MAHSSSLSTDHVDRHYQGGDRLIVGIVLSVITFWLFAQTTFNVLPSMRSELAIDTSVAEIAVSITALFAGVFIVVAGGLADRVGRVRITQAGLALSAAGSLLIAVSPTGTAAFLIVGRVIQGLSAACIMPATLSLMKAYYEGDARQRALSFWSIGSWGGSGVCALLGGVVDSTLGWRAIFWMSIWVALASALLIRGTPESKAGADETAPTDWTGLIAFLAAAVALSVVVERGAKLGWSSPATLALTAVCVVASLVFIRSERYCRHPFIDFRIFRSAGFSAATLSNFLLNGVAGALLVALLLVQDAFGLSSLQSGLMTGGYLVAIVTSIRVGEKLQQRWGGAREPMLLGCAITSAGLFLTTWTFLPVAVYVVTAFLGFTLFGVGLGIYATPSTDAALASVSDACAGKASGIYKMASSLGTAFGVTGSAAIWSSLTNATVLSVASRGTQSAVVSNLATHTMRVGAAVALWFNVAMALLALTVVMFGMAKQRAKAS